MGSVDIFDQQDPNSEFVPKNGGSHYLLGVPMLKFAIHGCFSKNFEIEIACWTISDIL